VRSWEAMRLGSWEVVKLGREKMSAALKEIRLQIEERLVLGKKWDGA